MFNLFRLCRKDEISFDIVAKNGTFDFVKEIVRLLHSTMLLRHCCGCGRGFSLSGICCGAYLTSVVEKDVIIRKRPKVDETRSSGVVL